MPADRVGRRPIRGYPRASQRFQTIRSLGGEIAPIAGNNLNSNEFRLEMAVADEYLGEVDGVINRLVVPVRAAWIDRASVRTASIPTL